MPCKFFRQGACQAGNSCPFSHEMNLTIKNQPCKYFQKGNCKFGVKCALAHVLLDGRKITQKSIPSNNHNHTYSKSNSPSQSDVNYSEPINVNAQYNLTSNQLTYPDQYQYPNTNWQALNMNSNYFNSYNYNNNNNNNNSFTSPASYPIAYNTALTSPIQPSSAALATSPFSNSLIWANLNGDNNPNITSSPTTTMANTNQKTVGSLSFSNSNIPNNMSTSVPTSSNSISNPNSSSFCQMYNNSSSQMLFASPNLSTQPTTGFNFRPDSISNITATTDTDDDSIPIDSLAIIDEDNTSSNENDNEDVDFIPSLLQDLLTPQELIRRKSRSSFGSQHNVILGFSNTRDNYNLVDENVPFIMD